MDTNENENTCMVNEEVLIMTSNHNLCGYDSAHIRLITARNRLIHVFYDPKFSV